MTDGTTAVLAELLREYWDELLAFPPHKRYQRAPCDIPQEIPAPIWAYVAGRLIEDHRVRLTARIWECQ